MSDLKSPTWIYVKGGLFLAILITSLSLILLEHFNWKMALLLALVIWSSARLYYFMFYVIEKYVDPQFKFAGIIAFVLYLFGQRKSRDS